MQRIVKASVSALSLLSVVTLLLSPGRAAERGEQATPSGAPQVELEVDSARWESGYGVKFFQVVGTVKNRSEKPVGAVRIRTELLDAKNEVVAGFDGWNGRAEALGELTGEASSAALTEHEVTPIPAGGTDRFRATFLADETPEFASQRVRVVKVLPAP